MNYFAYPLKLNPGFKRLPVEEKLGLLMIIHYLLLERMALVMLRLRSLRLMNLTLPFLRLYHLIQIQYMN